MPEQGVGGSGASWITGRRIVLANKREECPGAKPNSAPFKPYSSLLRSARWTQTTSHRATNGLSAGENYKEIMLQEHTGLWTSVHIHKITQASCRIQTTEKINTQTHTQTNTNWKAPCLLVHVFSPLNTSQILVPPNPYELQRKKWSFQEAYPSDRPRVQKWESYIQSMNSHHQYSRTSAQTFSLTSEVAWFFPQKHVSQVMAITG